MEQLFRHRVLKMLLNEGLIRENRVKVFDPVEFLAKLTSHVPNRGEHLTRHYGFTSSVKRGQRKKLGQEKPLADKTIEIEAPPVGRRPSADWARLIRRVYEVDPLVCPECGSRMNVISVIDTMDVIRKILKHLKLWEEPIPRAPPEPEQPPDIEYVPFLD
jgi:hypothetical protein